MNDLNSLLFEGILNADPVRLSDGSVIFPVISHRSSINVNGEVDNDNLRIHVATYSKLADVCLEYLKKNGGVRIVGRLGRSVIIPDSFCIIAEHVEFKPEYEEEV